MRRRTRKARPASVDYLRAEAKGLVQLLERVGERNAERTEMLTAREKLQALVLGWNGVLLAAQEASQVAKSTLQTLESEHMAAIRRNRDIEESLSTRVKAAELLCKDRETELAREVQTLRENIEKGQEAWAKQMAGIEKSLKDQQDLKAAAKEKYRCRMEKVETVLSQAIEDYRGRKQGLEMGFDSDSSQAELTEASHTQRFLYSRLKALQSKVAALKDEEISSAEPSVFSDDSSASNHSSEIANSSSENHSLAADFPSSSHLSSRSSAKEDSQLMDILLVNSPTPKQTSSRVPALALHLLNRPAVVLREDTPLRQPPKEIVPKLIAPTPKEPPIPRMQPEAIRGKLSGRRLVLKSRDSSGTSSPHRDRSNILSEPPTGSNFRLRRFKEAERPALKLGPRLPLPAPNRPVRSFIDPVKQ